MNTRLAQSPLAYQGYNRRRTNTPDASITESDFGTPLGEYMRSFWQPVALSSEVTRIPRKITRFGEELVVFRDGSNRIGLMQKHCAHRGASLEYGITQEKGIRCCYHGIHFDVTGEVLAVPFEKDGGARASRTICQPAYPTLERDGLIFAYLGNPADVPEFEAWDSFDKHDGTELVPFTNVFECNWLQVVENIADQIHTAALHQPKTLYDRDLPEGVDFDEFTLPSFGPVPELSYHAVRNQTAMAFVAGRRMSNDLVWWRINECILPNLSHHAYLFETGTERRLFHRVHMTRWYVPVDNHNSIIFGWRMFGSQIDPAGMGNRAKVGPDSMDFLGGQVGGRSYEQSQLLPGDYEAIVGQGKITSHSDENPLSGDVGVYLFRKILRAAISGSAAGANPKAMHDNPDFYFKSYTQNSVLNIPERSDAQADRAMIRSINNRIIDLMDEAASTDQGRDNFVTQGLADLERQYSDLK
jgi:phenylpropionate dioxygenase-like ring-hydroxylating dioxygenase large terminal subunit